MKYITFLLVAIATSVSAQNMHYPTTDLQLSNLKGKVKSLRAIPYTVANGKKAAIETDLDTVAKIANLDNLLKDYNPEGYTTQTRFFLQNGELYGRMENHYIHEGKQLIVSRYNSDKTMYAYSPEGYLTKEATYSPGGFLKSHYNYQRDENGNVTQEDTYRMNSLEGSIVYAYDKKGDAIEKKYLANDGSLLQAEKNKYNKQHLVVQTRNYNSKNDLLSTVKRKYNENNDCISLEAHIKIPKKEKNIVTYSYVYDAHGNWTSKTTYINGTPLQIIERTLEYYE